MKLSLFLPLLSLFLLTNVCHASPKIVKVSTGAANIIKSVKKAANIHRCGGKVDLGFILDSSGSLRHDYHKEKHFLNEITSAFIIGENATRVSVVTFSDHADLSIKFSDHYNNADLEKEVEKIPLMGHTTHLDKAFRTARWKMFRKRNGMRDHDVPKVLIVLTDGAQTKYPGYTDPHLLSNRLRNKKVKLIAIGIGKETDQEELDDIAGGPGKSFNAQTFDILVKNKFIARIAEEACDATKYKCKHDVDLGFILDSSGSLAHEYDKEKHFLAEMAKIFQIGENQTRVGVVTFSDHAEHSIKLNDHHDAHSFEKAVEAIPLMGHTTHLDKALRMTKNQMFTMENGGRETVQQVVVVLTDGAQTRYKGYTDPHTISNEMRRHGMIIIAIGIGHHVDWKELDEIAGGPGKGLNVSSFSDLISPENLFTLNRQTCERSKFSCEIKMDLGFILDSSGSLHDQYYKEKDFLKKITSTFHLGYNSTRASVVTFSDRTELSIKFKDYEYINQFNEAVDAIPLMGHTTHLDKAIRMARNDMFLEENGARGNLPKVLVILTDGAQTKYKGYTDPHEEANKLREDGVIVLAIGIGHHIDYEELDDIAGGDGKGYLVKSFDHLLKSSFKTDLSKKICKSTRLECQLTLDLGFVLDSSGSLANEYHKEKDFMKKIAGAFDINEEETLLSVVTFSDHADLSIKFSDKLTIESFNDAVDRIALMGHTTHLDKALDKVGHEMFARKNGARIRNARVLVILTDGAQTKYPGYTDPHIIANNLRKNLGLIVLVIGIGHHVDKNELDELAGGEGKAFMVKSFDELLKFSFMKDITTKICGKSSFQCTAPADLGFVLDSSGSLANEYHKEKDFLKRIAGMFPMGKLATRASVVTFSDHADHSIKFNDFFDIKAFQNATDFIPLMGHTTHLDKALRLAKKVMFSTKHGARKTARKILVILTDGAQTKYPGYTDPHIISNELRGHGVSIIALGVGKGIDVAELDDIAGGAGKAFKCQSFDHLITHKYIVDLAKVICKQITTTNVPGNPPAASPRNPAAVAPVMLPKCTLPEVYRCYGYEKNKNIYCSGKGIYKWFKENCKFMCGRCAYIPECNVDNKLCPNYLPRKDLYCKRHWWIKVNCPNMCGLCNSIGPVNVDNMNVKKKK